MFIQRLLRMTFTLGTGTFGTTGQNQLTVSGLRARAVIERAGGPSKSNLSLDVYGLPLTVINTLSTLGLVATTLRRNSVLVEAGDINGMASVFQGTISNAFGNFQSPPDVALHVDAFTGLLDALTPAPPLSFRGPVSAVTLLSGIANKLGFPFENNGVQAILVNPYYPGTLWVQAQQIVKHAGIAWNSCEDQTLAIWMPGFSRGGMAPLISPTTGLVGYPAFTGNGLSFRCIYNPSIGFGKQVVVQSSLLGNGTLTDGANKAFNINGANGTWVVNGMNHILETNVPNGSWFSDIQATPPGFAAVSGT